MGQARETGICPIREQVYSNMFDETINCPERGLMLQRCRNESKMTLRAYETLYETNLGYGSRKGIEANMSLEEIKNDLTTILEEKDKLKNEMEALKTQYEATEKRLQEETNTKNKQYQKKKKKKKKRFFKGKKKKKKKKKKS